MRTQPKGNIMTTITITSAKAALANVTDTVKGAAIVTAVVALQVPRLIGHAAEIAQCKLLGIEESI